jgi:hypothetical protein
MLLVLGWNYIHNITLKNSISFRKSGFLHLPSHETMIRRKKLFAEYWKSGLSEPVPQDLRKQKMVSWPGRGCYASLDFEKII